MIVYYDAIRKPVITEKASLQREKQGIYVFEVNKKANRLVIKEAIEKIFSVSVKKVNIANVKGKKVRRGRILGKKKDWKKAVVTLMPNQKIEGF